MGYYVFPEINRGASSASGVYYEAGTEGGVKNICNQCDWLTPDDFLLWGGCKDASDDKEHCDEFMCLFRGTDAGTGLTSRYVRLLVKKWDKLDAQERLEDRRISGCYVQ